MLDSGIVVFSLSFAIKRMLAAACDSRSTLKKFTLVVRLPRCLSDLDGSWIDSLRIGLTDQHSVKHQ